jgi:hypothetical protein
MLAAHLECIKLESPQRSWLMRRFICCRISKLQTRLNDTYVNDTEEIRAGQSGLFIMYLQVHNLSEAVLPAAAYISTPLPSQTCANHQSITHS